MKEVNPRRIMSGPPTLFGVLGATALLIACVVLPEELFGYRTPYLFGGILLAVFFLLITGCFLWVAVRAVFGKKRT